LCKDVCIEYIDLYFFAYREEIELKYDGRQEEMIVTA